MVHQTYTLFSKLACLAAVLALGVPTIASASLISNGAGDEIGAFLTVGARPENVFNLSDSSQQALATISNGIEFEQEVADIMFQVDFTANAFSIRMTPGRARDMSVRLNLAFSFTDLEWIDPDTGLPGSGIIIGVIPTSALPVGTSIDFTNHDIMVNFGLGAFLPEDGRTFDFNILTFKPTDPPVVPEPTTLTLFGLGLGALAYRRRTR